MIKNIKKRPFAARLRQRDENFRGTTQIYVTKKSDTSTVHKKPGLLTQASRSFSVNQKKNSEFIFTDSFAPLFHQAEVSFNKIQCYSSHQRFL